MGSFLPEEIVAALPPGHLVFFQLYVGTNHESTKRLLESVVALKAEAITVTVDLSVIDKREDVRRLQMQTSPPNNNKETSKSASNLAIDPDISWTDIRWIREITGFPTFVKGIQSAENAKIALSEGCADIYISNHRGRAVDTAQPAILTLLEIIIQCPEVLERMDVFIDGGTRRGTDILKAICPGRLILHALTYGQNGIEHALNILKELDVAMQLCGIKSLDEAHPGLLNAAALERFVYGQKAQRARRIVRGRL